MNVLMIGNCASVGWNLTQGLRKKNINVVFVGNSSKCISGRYDCHLSWRDFLQKGYGKKHFDIIHIHSPNFKKLGLVWRYLNSKCTSIIIFAKKKELKKELEKWEWR